MRSIEEEPERDTFDIETLRDELAEMQGDEPQCNQFRTMKKDYDDIVERHRLPSANIRAVIYQIICYIKKESTVSV